MARLPRKQPVRGKRPPRDKAPAPLPQKPRKLPRGRGGSKMSDIKLADPKTMRPPVGKIAKGLKMPKKLKPSKPMPPRKGIPSLPTVPDKNKPSLPTVPRKRPLRKLGRGMARMVK